MDIASIRTGLGLTQAEFAAALGISNGYVGDLETGRRTISLPLAIKLEKLTKRADIVPAVVAEKQAAA